jgi:hypothetical protein
VGRVASSEKIDPKKGIPVQNEHALLFIATWW